MFGLNKYLLVGAGAIVGSMLIAIWFLNGKADRAVAKAAQYESELLFAVATNEKQKGVISHLQGQNEAIIKGWKDQQDLTGHIAIRLGELIEQGQQRVKEDRENVEQAGNLMDDSDWWCASERVPDIVIDGLHYADGD